MNAIKDNFIKAIQSAHNIEDIDNTIADLPNCFAKGYIVARLEILTNNTDDYECVVEEIIEWANYEIWF